MIPDYVYGVGVSVIVGEADYILWGEWCMVNLKLGLEGRNRQRRLTGPVELKEAH